MNECKFKIKNHFMSKQFKRVIHFSYLNIFVLPFFTIFTVKNISYEKNYIVRR
jgi:hypothetical protein